MGYHSVVRKDLVLHSRCIEEGLRCLERRVTDFSASLQSRVLWVGIVSVVFHALEHKLTLVLDASIHRENAVLMRDRRRMSILLSPVLGWQLGGERRG